MAKILTQAEIDQFWNQGYVFPFDCLTTAEARDARARLEAYEAGVEGDISKHLRVKVHMAFPWLMDLARHPALLDAAEDLIGPDILLYLSTFWFKDAHDPRYVSWHQDSAYYGLDPHDVVTLWLAFTDSTPANGCVRVVPRTHLGQSFVHTETHAADNLLARGQSIEDIDASGAVDLVLKAGQFSLHHERLVHGSAPNASGDRRLGMSFTLLPTRVRCVIPGRTATLVRGVDDHGHWGVDPEPRRDLDPDCMAAIRYWKDEYANPAIAQEADQAG